MISNKPCAQILTTGWMTNSQSAETYW